MEQVQKKNILGTEPIVGLLRQFAVPSIIAMLVGALYNIVDQFFIGRSVGELGNAATNVAFPLTISCVALALLFGIGGAASFNLTLGGGDREKALFYIGNAATLLFGSGVILGIVALLCLTPMLRFFGSPDNVLAYAKTYTGITALGFPFLILTNGGGHLVRADGSPRNAMLYNLSGALINTVLDPLFIFVLGFGVQGAAIATVISQALSAVFVFVFLTRKSELKVRFLKKKEFSECIGYAKNIVSLGTAGFIMQLTNSLVSICCNNILSDVGGDIYISVMTIVSSVRQLVETPIYAMNEGTSPILSYNYGACRPARVRKAMAVMSTMILGYTAVMWSIIILFPNALIGIFSSDAALMQDAVPALKQYFAAFICMDFQYIGQTVFKSLNKKKQAIFFSLLRKVFIVVPLTYMMPYMFHMGTAGVFLAEPVSNVIGGTLCLVVMLCTVLPELKRMEKQNSKNVLQ